MPNYNLSDYDEILSNDGTFRSFSTARPSKVKSSKNCNLIFSDGRKSVFEVTHQQRTKSPRSFTSVEKPKSKFYF